MSQQPFENIWQRGNMRRNTVDESFLQMHRDVEVPDYKNSVLRVDAPEFVPFQSVEALSLEMGLDSLQLGAATDSPQPVKKGPRPGVQNRLERIKQSSQEEASAPPVVSHNTAFQDALPQSAEIPKFHDEETDMIRLKQVVSSLVRLPGQFDDLLTVFMETVYPYLNDIFAMSRITHLIVSEAIKNPSFRYNGARICWYVEQQSPEFRAELHLKCQKELLENMNKHDVVLFIAELYVQLPHVTVYGKLLIDTLVKMLIIAGQDNIKCACQTLKLTGHSLQQNYPEDLERIVQTLRAFSESLSGSYLEILNSVLKLKESNWGQPTSAVASSSSDHDEFYVDHSNHRVFETPELKLTDEEYEFLLENHVIIDDDDSESDPDGLYDPEPEMDQEIQDAFRNFVRKG